MSSINEALRRANHTGGPVFSYPTLSTEKNRSRTWMTWALAILVIGILAFGGGALAWKFRTTAPPSVAGQEAAQVKTAASSPRPDSPSEAGPVDQEPVVAMAGPDQSTSVDLTEFEAVEPGPDDQEALADGPGLSPAQAEVLVARARPVEPPLAKPQPAVLAPALPARPDLLPLPGEEPTGESQALQARELFQRARAAQEDGRDDEAISGYRQAILQDPGLTEAYLNLGNLLFYHGGDEAGAEAMYDQVLKLDPDNKLAQNNLGVIRLEKGLLDKAEESFTKALKLDPQYVDAMYNLACLTARQGRADLTISYLKKVGRLNPEVVGWVAKDHDFDGLRDSPAFVKFVAGNK